MSQDERTTELATTTTPIAVEPAAPPARRIALLSLAVAAGAFLVGIAVATATRDEPTDTVIARSTIGPSGGIMRFDGGEVRVPEGAVDEPTRFAVRRSTSDARVQVRAVDEPIVFEPGDLVGYAFDPTDVTFNEPVTINFRLPSGASDGTIFARRGEAVILLPGRVDAARGVASTDVTDFDL